MTNPPDQNSDIPLVYRYTNYAMISFNRANPEAERTANKWIGNRFGAWSLFVTGANGVGKTCYAAKILMEIRKQFPMSISAFITPEAFTRVARQLDQGDVVFEQWTRGNPIVLDDIGAARATPHVTEKLVHLLMNRYENRKKTIITTNMTVSEFAHHVDPRIASRLQEGMMLHMGGKDLRSNHP